MRSTLRAALSRARRGGSLLKGAGQKLSGAAGSVLRSPAVSSVRERIRTARRAAAKRGRAAVPFVLRAVGAGIAAGAAGLAAAVCALPLAAVAAATGGVLRRLGLVRRGRVWGSRLATWPRAVAGRVWRRLMGRARRKYDDATGRRDVQTDFEEPTRRPTQPSKGGSLMTTTNSPSRFALATEAIRTAYASYEPPNMISVVAEYKGLPEGLAHAAEPLRRLALNTAGSYPADQRLADQITLVYLLMHQAVEKAQEILPLMLRLHEHDLLRYTAPRTNEQMWNIGEVRPGGDHVLGPSLFQRACEEASAAYAQYFPEKMMQVGVEYAGVPAGLENVAAAVGHLSAKSAEVYPVEQPIAEAVREVHVLLVRAAAAAEELFPMFRRLHAKDIQRHENPRNGPQGESLWDV
ncbi:hypothetical protein SMD11_3097 [Streptomyces albireticuli]|uniref:Uncharacterized protein n=1 Tax=Streptomyces albireticuli TaxID=1940 RepID=A0A1Z2L3F1_9ACTN|nr:hypothetical protein [Streptomyces albireticuli]ARZ68741.1 hypothetical protein SMD11_3097 [Streptomyces albireticuli]